MAKSGSKIVLAGLAGLAAGIALGVLFAPSKGSKIRKRLKDNILDFADIIDVGLADQLRNKKASQSTEEEEEPPEAKGQDKD